MLRDYGANFLQEVVCTELEFASERTGQLIQSSRQHLSSPYCAWQRDRTYKDKVKKSQSLSSVMSCPTLTAPKACLAGWRTRKPLRLGASRKFSQERGVRISWKRRVCWEEWEREQREMKTWNLCGQAGREKCWRNNGKSDWKGGLGTLVGGIICHAKEWQSYPMGKGDQLIILRQGCDMFRAVFKREILPAIWRLTWRQKQLAVNTQWS